MKRQPSLAQALEAYLGVGTRTLPWPSKDAERLALLVGDDWPAWKERLDAVLEPLTDLPPEWRHEPLTRLGPLASARAKRLHPEFRTELCDAIGGLFSFTWK